MSSPPRLSAQTLDQAGTSSRQAEAKRNVMQWCFYGHAKSSHFGAVFAGRLEPVVNVPDEMSDPPARMMGCHTWIRLTIHVENPQDDFLGWVDRCNLASRLTLRSRRIWEALRLPSSRRCWIPSTPRRQSGPGISHP